MTMFQELEIEYDGMQGTIQQYSRDPYIMSYLDKLKIAIKNEEVEMIGIMITKLNSWYEENITSIERNKWIINLDSHYKTHRLLKEYSLKLN